MKNKKGFFNQLAIVVILAVVLICIILFAWVGGIIGPIISTTGNDVSNSLHEATLNDPDLSNASDTAFIPANEGLQNSEWIVYFFIIILFLTFIIMAFYVRTYPFLAFIWIGIIIVLAMISIYLSNAYQEIASDGTMNLQSWENTHFLLSNLPQIVVIIGIIGGIAMFILSSREQEAEAQPQGI